MEDRLELSPPHHLITPEDLTRFHVAKGVKAPTCWACGTAGWYIQNGGGVVAHRTSWIMEDGTESEGGWLTFNLVCTNCATIWPMDYGSIIQWLRENPIQANLLSEGALDESVKG